MSEPLIVTLGCRLNAFESEVMRSEAAAAGLSDAVIVNTCAVTSEAVRQARQTVRRLRRLHPRQRIVVTGCAAQLAPETFAAMPEVDRVLGNAEKLSRAHLAAATPLAVADIMSVRETAGHLVAGFEGRARAFVQIQQGCDHRCTFCIIPFARGPNRSVPPGEVIALVRSLVARGYGEVVLTGVDICSYGRDDPELPGLGGLVRALLAAVPELPRLRLSSLDPAAIDDEVFAALGEDERLMPHWHLSVQALDDLVLKRMKRRHLRADVFALIGRARAVRPDIVFGADLIAGFPTETEAMFEASAAAVVELGLTWLHVFPYSPRPDTPAARMPQVAGPERRARAAQLRALGEAAKALHHSACVGKRTTALIEDGANGRTPDYATVRLERAETTGRIVPVRITGATAEHLIGEAL